MSKNFIEKNQINNYKFLFSINTLCGEKIDFYKDPTFVEKTLLNEICKNETLKKDIKILFFSNGSQLNSITANLICEIFNSDKKLDKEIFWKKFPIKLNGYREESIKNIVNEFSKIISLIE